MGEPTVRHLPVIPPFDPDDNRATAGARFEEWSELVDLHILATGVRDEDRKKAIMMSIGGLPFIKLTIAIDITPHPAVQADKNVNPPVAAQAAESPYTALKRALKSHFNPALSSETRDISP